MAKDINIHLKTTGAEDAKRKLSSVGKSATQVGDSAKQGGAKASQGLDKMSQSAGSAQGHFAKLKSSILSWLAGIVGIAAAIRAITTAIRIQAQAITEHATIAAEQQKKLLALQAMGAFFEEHPEARKEVAAYAEFGRRPFPEVAEAWYALESKAAGLTDEQKRGIMREALELGRMEPEADLKSIIEIFSLYAKETHQTDINQIQNVIRATLSKAGAELSQMGQYLPRFLSLGIAGGLTGAETAGLWAFATTRAPTPESATVGIRNIFAALRGKGTPESLELLQKLGIKREQNIFEQLTILSARQKAGRFGLPEAEMIAGKENIAVLLSMLTEPAAMMETVREITGVARPDIDIVRDKLEEIMGKDRVAYLEEEGRRLDVAIQNLKGADISALKWSALKKSIELESRQRGRAEFFITLDDWLLSMMSIFGTPEQAVARLKKVSELPNVRLMRAGAALLIPEAPTEPAAEPELPAEQPPVIEQAEPVSMAPRVYHYYDNGIHYHPKVGEDLVGSRFPA